ncbi:MAG: TetR/AcrR family transcriptional regulator [Burkholderiales bacterium]|jgi:AcrR family transcriptional regulator|nr:TetR/AcrR family transcriptional regulator [Burkholderiales bacterium]
MTITRRSFTIGAHTPRKRQKAATRERILQAAKQLFAEHGYEAATMQKIAQATGLSTGNVFVHFPSKADVLATLMHEDIAALDQLIAKQVPRRGTVRTRLLKVFGVFLDYAVPTERLLRTLVAYSWSWDEHWEARFEGSIAIRKKQIQTILEDGIRSGEIRADADLEAVGICIFGIAETLFKAARFYGYDRSRFLDQADQALGVLLAGVGAVRAATRSAPTG